MHASLPVCVLVIFWYVSRELIIKGEFCNEVELRKCYSVECNLKQVQLLWERNERWLWQKQRLTVLRVLFFSFSFELQLIYKPDLPPAVNRFKLGSWKLSLYWKFHYLWCYSFDRCAGNYFYYYTLCIRHIQT